MMVSVGRWSLSQVSLNLNQVEAKLTNLICIPNPDAFLKGARRILESQKPPNSRNKNRQIEEPLSESSLNRKWQSPCYSLKNWQICEIVET
jgi:hypothetical protein